MPPDKVQEIIDLFIQYSGYKRPFTVLLDITVLIRKIDLPKIKSFLRDYNAKLCITKCIKEELLLFNRTHTKSQQVSLNYIKDLKVLKCNHECNSYHENCILKMIGDYNESHLVVVTASDKLYKECRNDFKVLVVKLKDNLLCLEKPDKSAKSIDHMILIDDHKRLKLRSYLFRFTETNVGIGADSLFTAVAVVFKLDGHKSARDLIATYIRTHWVFYKDIFDKLVDGDYDTFLTEVGLPDKWANSMTLQAVADKFGVKVVLMTGSREKYLMEYVPKILHKDRPHENDMKVCFFSYLEGHRFGILKFEEKVTLDKTNLDIKNLYVRSAPKLKNDFYLNLKGGYELIKEDLKKYDNIVKSRLKTLSLKQIEMLGEGECLFHAFAYFLGSLQNNHESTRDANNHGSMRDAVVRQLRDNPDLYREEIYNSYVELFLNPPVVADCIGIQACADVFHCQFTVVTPSKLEIMYGVYPTESPNYKICSNHFFLSDFGRYNKATVLAPRKCDGKEL